jgi:FKBP-type peptidyl-prolyl cis-trans isomerase SlyD
MPQMLGMSAAQAHEPVALRILVKAGYASAVAAAAVAFAIGPMLVYTEVFQSLVQRSYPMLIAANKAVSIDYTLTNDVGEVIDSSAGGAPLVYLHGAGNIIPGLEKALEGKQPQDEVDVTIEPEDAYGEYSAEMVSTLNRSMFEGVDELEVGMQFHASAPDGQMQIVTIRDLDGDDVTVDGNHPLAGQRLNFKVKVVNVRDASEEEIAHGHVHGEGGHHH